MFDFLKNKKDKIHILGAPAKGDAVPIQEVKDPTFSEELLGKGVAVIPTQGEIYAPADGVVGMVFDTLHAVSMTTEYGAEILIHVGLDTVKLKGEGYKGHVKAGDKVKQGDLLLTVDLEKVQKAGFDVITPMLICNTSDYAAVESMAGKAVNVGDQVLMVREG